MAKVINSGRQLLAVVVLVGVFAEVGAEPVEVRQGDQIGAGYTFLRGSTCTVVTVRHAVPYDGVDVEVLDRSGGKAIGSRTYDNETYDLALVTLNNNSVVACTAKWPDTGWIPSTSFTSQNLFELVRHTPDDRETIISVRYAGGTSDTVTVAPIDMMKVQATFSGAVVRAQGQLLAIVQRVDPATSRIEALRFDVIDRLVGGRFKAATRGSSPVYFAGVFQGQRVNSNWTTYMTAWLRDKGGREVVPKQDDATRCTIRINVIDWTRGNVPNPEYASLQQRYDTCGTTELLGKMLVLQSSRSKAACQKEVRSKMQEVGRTLQSHRLTIEMTMSPRNGAVESKLESVQVTRPGRAAGSRTEEELEVLQGAAGPLAARLLQTGVCD